MINPRAQRATAQRIPRSHHRSTGLDGGSSMLSSRVADGRWMVSEQLTLHATRDCRRASNDNLGPSFL